MANMRRAHSVRNYGKTPLAPASDDLGILREGDEPTIEDVLRRQLLDKDRENDKVSLIKIMLDDLCCTNELTWTYSSFNQRY
jgi:hypothetical protein